MLIQTPSLTLCFRMTILISVANGIHYLCVNALPKIILTTNFHEADQRNPLNSIYRAQGRMRKERGQGGGVSPFPYTFKSSKHFSGQGKCSNFIICSYFVVKNTIFQNFLGSLRSPTSRFSELRQLKTLK